MIWVIGVIIRVSFFKLCLQKNHWQPLLLSLLFTFLTGCQSFISSKPKKSSEIKDTIHVWEGDLTLEQNQKKYFLKAYLQTVQNQKLRVDIITKWNTGILSLVLKKKQVKYLFHRQKKYYHGNISHWKSSKRFFSFPFNPIWIHNVLANQPLDKKNWTCLMKKKQDQQQEIKVSGEKKRKEENKRPSSDVSSDLKEASEKKTSQKAHFKAHSHQQDNKHISYSCKNLKSPIQLNWTSSSDSKSKTLFLYDKQTKLKMILQALPPKRPSSSLDIFDVTPPKHFQIQEIK